MAPGDPSPGVFDRALALPGGGRVRYTIRVPERYQPGRPVPLVLSLHYAGDVTPYFGRDLLEGMIEPALGELGAIVVAPESVDGDWTTDGNVAAVGALLDETTRYYSIDRARTLVTGYSMGGLGAWEWAVRAPDLFAAAIPMAGTPPAAPAGCPTSTLVLYSEADRLFPADRTRAVVDALRARGCSVDARPVVNRDHFDMGPFVPALAATVPWLRDTWAGRR